MRDLYQQQRRSHGGLLRFGQDDVERPGGFLEGDDQRLADEWIAAEPRVAPTLVRASDPPEIVGDASRLRQLTGWEPAIPLRQTLQDLVSSIDRR